VVSSVASSMSGVTVRGIVVSSCVVTGTDLWSERPKDWPP
jgi:hypothetical protein